MGVARIIVVIAAVLAIASIASAQDEAAKCEGSAEVAFDHEAKPSVQSSSLKRKDGEKLLIRVVNTDPKVFTYTVTGAVAIPRSDSLLELRGTPTYETCVTHSREFGGYVMKVEKKPGEKSGLDDKLFIVYVETPSWKYEVAGAFSFAWLTDPVYALERVSNTTFKVIRDEGTETEPKEDNVRLGVAALITVFHSGLPQVGPSFGLGVNDGQQATYYLGGTWRFGDVAGLTVGGAFGSVNRLPGGIDVGDEVTDANTLNNLPKRIDLGWFVSLSFSFLGSTDRLKKPFAGQ